MQYGAHLIRQVGFGGSDDCFNLGSTVCVAAGRKDKLRAGDILGVLIGADGLEGKSVGKIDVMDYQAYVSVQSKFAKKALARLTENKIKGTRFKGRLLE